MQTSKAQTVHRLTVEFSEEEYRLLVVRVGDPEPGTEAEYIHDLVMRSLNRKKRVKAEDQG